MNSKCPKCGGSMKSFTKHFSESSVGPFSVKKLLPSELQEYNSIEVKICESCGYMELYWRK